MFTLLTKLWSNKPHKFSISDDFIPYMVQRWISFGITDDELLLLDEKVNCNKNLHLDRQRFFDTCRKLFGTGNRRVSYIKHLNRERVGKNSEHFKKFCEMVELPEREVKDYLKINPHIMEEFEKAFGLYKK